MLGLELGDVSFDRLTVTLRPRSHQRLKARTSRRVVPLFPQLAEILRAYVFGPRLGRPGRLLFPSFATGAEAPVVDVRKLIDCVAVRAGWKKGDLTTRGVPPHLDRRTAPDARPRGAGEPLHREQSGWGR